MSAHPTSNANQSPLGTSASVILILLAFVWVFLGTIDGPAVNLGIDTGSVVYKKAKALDREAGAEPRLVSIGAYPQEPPRVHASFLLFDFKQNLRRWPNVAGDISRSPPFFLA